jgi:alkylated DNA nucleotide flippase Atl1
LENLSGGAVGKVVTYGQVADYLQKNLLEQEGIGFNRQGKIDLKKYRSQAPINLK